MATKAFTVEEIAIGDFDGVVSGEFDYRVDDGLLTITGVRFASVEFWLADGNQDVSLTREQMATVRYLIVSLLAEIDGIDTLGDRVALSAMDRCESMGIVGNTRAAVGV